jgi:hypothetical protein
MEATLKATSETGKDMTLCFNRCEHDECAQRHAIAASFCRLCRTSIGYSARFHQDTRRASGYVHSLCLAEVLPRLTSRPPLQPSFGMGTMTIEQVISNHRKIAA